VKGGCKKNSYYSTIEGLRVVDFLFYARMGQGTTNAFYGTSLASPTKSAKVIAGEFDGLVPLG